MQARWQASYAESNLAMEFNNVQNYEILDFSSSIMSPWK